MTVAEWWWLYEAKTGFKERTYSELLKLIEE